VVPAGSPEVAAMRGFRDALRADPRLRRRYAALKRAIVAGGPADPVAFTKAKHDWITATLTHLGLASDQPRRLYQDDLNQDGSRRLASRSTPHGSQLAEWSSVTAKASPRRQRAGDRPRATVSNLARLAEGATFMVMTRGHGCGTRWWPDTTGRCRRWWSTGRRALLWTRWEMAAAVDRARELDRGVMPTGSRSGSRPRPWWLATNAPRGRAWPESRPPPSVSRRWAEWSSLSKRSAAPATGDFLTATGPTCGRPQGSVRQAGRPARITA
jgi:GrpB protein